jgi:hypothetical protein
VTRTRKGFATKANGETHGRSSRSSPSIPFFLAILGERAHHHGEHRRSQARRSAGATSRRGSPGAEDDRRSLRPAREGPQAVSGVGLQCAAGAGRRRRHGARVPSPLRDEAPPHRGALGPREGAPVLGRPRALGSRPVDRVPAPPRSGANPKGAAPASPSIALSTSRPRALPGHCTRGSKFVQ